MTADRGIAIAVMAWVSAMPAAFSQGMEQHVGQGQGQGIGQGAGQGSGQGRVRSAGVSMREASYLGIGVEDVDADRARNLKLKEEHGAYITSVMPDTPAFKVGIKQGDVILEYNGQHVEGKDQLIRMVRATPAGKLARITLWRNGAPLTLVATVGSHKVVESEDGNFSFELPNMPSMPNLPPGFNMPPIDIPRMITIMQNRSLGIEGESLAQQPQLAEFFGVKDGVLVKSVTKDSPAEHAGVKAGDVIARIGDTHIATSRDLTTALRSAQAGRTLSMVVVRNRKDTPLTVNIEDRQ